MRLRSILSLFVALCSPILVAQTLTVGNVHARMKGFASGPVAGVTYIDLVHPAPAAGTLTRASFEYAVWGSCHHGVMIKFFRPEGDTVRVIAQRGPFDGPSFDVALSPPVEVQAGDLIGLVRLGCPYPNAPGHPVLSPPGEGAYLAFGFDITGMARVSEGTTGIGTLLVYATGEAVSEANERCTLQTFAGSYAFYEKGSSAIFDPTSQPYPSHWSGALAPFITVGRVTMGPDGVGDGRFWIRVGSLHGGLEPIPVAVTITEMNEDCTGKFTAQFELAGQPETILERFILFDGGREFRAIPIGGGPETLAWIMEGHRISKPGEPLDTCGPHTAKGTYVWAVENLIRFDMPYPIFADTVLLRIDVPMSGAYAGTLYEKMGPVGGIELPVWGTIEVNPDCTFAQELGVVVGGVPFTDPIRGVFFDGGKRAFGLSMNTEAIGMQYSFGQAVQIGQ